MTARRRILVIGADGQLGWELRRALATLGDVVACDFPAVDLAKHDALRAFVRQVDPALIVNSAAYTAVDQAEEQPDLARAVNAVAPGVLSEEAKARGIPLVHYSTDYVFDGTKATPYTEEDPPRPLSLYGQTKLDGERAITGSGCEYLLFRTSWVFAGRGKNFLLTMRRLGAEREELRVVADQIGAPTWSRSLADATAQVLAQLAARDRALRPGPLGGTYNATSAGETSWHGFASAILMDPAGEPRRGLRCRRVVPLTTPEYPTRAKRPPNSRLSNEKLERTFGLRLPTWERALELVLEELAARGGPE